MSKDPKPAPMQGKTPNEATEATETDLWDLDSEDSGAESTQDIAPEKPDSLPERRKSTSNLQSKKPIERNIEVPTIAPSKTEEEAEPEESAQPESTPAPDKEETPEDKPDVPDSDESAARPTLPSFTRTERIALSALFGVLLLAAVMAIVHFSNRVPIRPLIAEEPDFPISGDFVEIRSATTYWRKPVTSGENAEVVRRGTALIPVVRLSLESKPSAIRVFFRNGEGILIGDGISRDASGGQDLTIPATAGFDDIGMHAAYRTGEEEPWTVEVYEGSSRGADRKDFRKLLDIQISTDIR